MSSLDLYAGGVLMPSPVEISTDSEILWAEDSGRTLSGQMVADVVAEKKALSITWGFLTETELETIKTYITTGFFTLSVLGLSLTVYRGTLTATPAGIYGGTLYYKSASVKVVEQ